VVHSDTQSNVWEMSIPSGWLMQHLLASRNTLLLCRWKRCCISFLVEQRLSLVVVWFVVGRPFSSSSSFISCPHKIIVCPFCWWQFDFIIPSKFAIYYFFSSFFLLFFFLFVELVFIFNFTLQSKFFFFYFDHYSYDCFFFFLHFCSINFSFQFWFLFF
jgi:hypothetical protein